MGGALARGAGAGAVNAVGAVGAVFLARRHQVFQMGAVWLCEVDEPPLHASHEALAHLLRLCNVTSRRFLRVRCRRDMCVEEVVVVEVLVFSGFCVFAVLLLCRWWWWWWWWW